MEEGAEDRRKRLRAMATEAAAVGQNEIPLASAPLSSTLPNPLATSMPPAQPPPPPYPPGFPPHQPHWGHVDAYPTSFGRGGGRRGGGRGGRGRGRAPRGGGGGRGGRGGGRGHHNPPAANIEAYFSPQMLSNPWIHLERRQVPGTNYNAEDGSAGKFDNEASYDRPWH